MLGLVLATALSASDPRVARLADLFAHDLLETTRGEGVAIEAPANPAGSFFGDKVQEELKRRGARPSSLRARGVLTNCGSRLCASFRIEDGENRLTGVVSASVAGEVEPGTSPEVVASTGTLHVALVSRSPIEGSVLALAGIGADRLAVLTTDAVLLVRRGASPTIEVREALPPPLQTMRAPAGVLESTEGDFLWVLANRTGRADFLAIDGHRVSWGASARLPPGFPPELGYRPGTNLLEGLPDGPFLAWLPGEPGFAVDTHGTLIALHPGSEVRTEVRVGPALARLGGLLVASGPLSPGEKDRLLFLDAKDLSLVDTADVPGAVRALATRPGGDEVDVALETSTGTEILTLRVTR